MKKIMLLLVALLWISGCEGKQENLENANANQPKVKLLIDDAYTLMDDKKLMKMFYDYNKKMLEEFDVDFRVISTMTKEDINLYANRQFNMAQQQSRSKSGKALLLVVNPMQDQVRLEVSTALEPVYTDAFISYIERKGFVPYFRENKIADGVYMAMELIRDRAHEAKDGKEFMPPMQSQSIGGGAKTKAQIGIANPKAKAGDHMAETSTETPKQLLERYIEEVLKKHNKNPNLGIYTDTTKAFFSKWTVTDINQDHEIHNLSSCTNKMQTLYSSDRSHAVLAVLPYGTNRKCAPYFFKKWRRAWKMDIATMAQILQFNQNMEMHFDMKQRLEKEGKYYAFAFDGYWFDQNGYPHTPKKDYSDWKKYRWKYNCNGYLHPGDKKEDAKCWIRFAVPGGAASVRLGLNGMDKIYGIGDGANRKEDVPYKEVISYLNSVPSGEVATVIIEHYYLNGKETFKFDDILKSNIEVRYEKRQGIAP